MANPEHLIILKQGVEIWNQWRHEYPEIEPDLHAADLRDLMANRVNLAWTDLREANLAGACLTDANLTEASLHHVNLEWADLTCAILSGTNLLRANLHGADLSGSHLSRVDLREAALNDSHLHEAHLLYSNLRHANLAGADLSGARIYRCDLDESNWRGVLLNATLLTHLDLGAVYGLETARHDGPSTIGIDTLYLSNGNIAPAFLHGCGVPETAIALAQSLIGQARPFFSTLILYASTDQELAQQLQRDLGEHGLRVWLGPEDLPDGRRRRHAEEDHAVHDKFLLLLSRESIASDWIELHVDMALEREQRENSTLLFPLRLDDTMLQAPGKWPDQLRRTRYLNDFSQWRDPAAYQTALARLVRDLQID
ncbi:MAG: toll/interleukin-1 receptor domain-containing protein [Anaerolineae bacterium]